MSGSTLGVAATSLFGTLLALGLVLGLAYLGLKGLRRLQERAAGADASGPGLKVIRALGVGPRERIVIVEADGERLLIGVAAGQVSLLSRLGSTARPEIAP